ncbi:MAG: iron-containing alcohol dehydrogenase [Verrucomicrobia bacterium]|nr:iron-containing alcohol dehydrogenase [Verrucomicrobiota bacterium]
METQTMSATNSWTFKLPTAVTFGAGCIGQLPQITAARGARPLLVADRDLVKLPPFARVQQVLLGVPVFSDVTPDPTVASVDALAARLRAEKHDVVVAVGGGSAMDCAKAAACLAAGNLSSIRAVHSEGVPLGSARLPLIAVPTTAGTGSEVTPFAVLSDTEKQVKGPIAGDALYPVHAVVDPELTHSLPLKVTIVTGLDALCHAIEGYWSRNHQPICDVMAIEAARLICANLKRAAQQPGDADARSAMSYAATLAGAAFQLPKNAMVHACSFPLSARFHMAHGTACAFTLEEAIRFNAPVMGERMTAFLRGAGLGSAEELVALVRELKQLGGLPCTLRDAGIPAAEIPNLAKESFHPLMKNNPRTMTEADLVAMYERLV